MRVAMLEDEVPAAARLASLLARVAPEAELVATWPTVSAAVAGLPDAGPLDLLLCDVRLGDGSVFTLFDQVDLDVPVVFTTSYDAYLQRAFDHNGIGYLLKPIREAELAAALGKARRLQRHFLERRADGQLAPAAPSGPEGPATRFLARKGTALVPVSVSEVAWFLSQHKVLFLVHRDGRRMMMDGTLAELEPRLDPARFFRLDRRVIAQIDAVRAVRPAGRGRLSVELSPPSVEEVRVSQGNAAAFRAWLGGS